MVKPAIPKIREFESFSENLTASILLNSWHNLPCDFVRNSDISLKVIKLMRINKNAKYTGLNKPNKPKNRTRYEKTPRPNESEKNEYSNLVRFVKWKACKNLFPNPYVTNKIINNRETA